MAIYVQLHVDDISSFSSQIQLVEFHSTVVVHRICFDDVDAAKNAEIFYNSLE